MKQRKAEANNSAVGVWLPGSSESWLRGSTLIALSFSSVLVERNAGTREHNRIASQICSGGVSAVIRCLRLNDSSVEVRRTVRQSVQSRIAVGCVLGEAEYGVF